MVENSLSRVSGKITSPLLKRRWCHSDDDHQAGDDEAESDEADENDAASRGRKFAADNVVLRFEVAMKTNEQNQDRYPKKPDQSAGTR